MGSFCGTSRCRALPDQRHAPSGRSRNQGCPYLGQHGRAFFGEKRGHGEKRGQRTFSLPPGGRRPGKTVTLYASIYWLSSCGNNPACSTGVPLRGRPRRRGAGRPCRCCIRRRKSASPNAQSGRKRGGKETQLVPTAVTSCVLFSSPLPPTSWVRRRPPNSAHFRPMGLRSVYELACFPTVQSRQASYRLPRRAHQLRFSHERLARAA